MNELICPTIQCDYCGDEVSIEKKHKVFREVEDKLSVFNKKKKRYLCFKCFDNIVWTKEQKNVDRKDN